MRLISLTCESSHGSCGVAEVVCESLNGPPIARALTFGRKVGRVRVNRSYACPHVGVHVRSDMNHTPSYESMHTCTFQRL